MRAGSKDSTGLKSTGHNSGSGSLGVINSIANGISKKSFFKGFLGRAGSSKNEGSREKGMNKSLNISTGTSAQRNAGSLIGMGSNHLNMSNMQSVAMNMMAFKNSK